MVRATDHATSAFEDVLARAAAAEQRELARLFESLRSINDDAFLFGDWKGGLFHTGHPGERQIRNLGWDGKCFHARDHVEPMITLDDAGRRVANPVMGTARLRQVGYRGVVTATMIYDRHPIMDHFKHVNDDVVMGVMDRKGDDLPLYFYLTRITDFQSPRD